MKQHFRRIGGFALLPALSVLASVVISPLISARFGPPGWVALSLGQSVGAVVSVIAGLAWPAIGGNAVAAASNVDERRDIFRISVYSRLVVLLALCVVTVPLTFLLAPHYPWSVTLFMLGVSANGLTAGWYFTGLGTPRSLVMNEGIVRFTGYLVALAGLMAGAPLIWYAACTVLVGIVMAFLNWFSVIGRGPFRVPGGLTLALRSIREQLGGTVSRVLSAMFMLGGPPIYAAVAPAHLPLFSALDQVHKTGNNTLNFLPGAFVHWVGSAGNAEAPRRIRLSLWFLTAVSVVLVPAWLLVGPTIVKFLYADQLTVTWPTQLLLVLAISGQLVLGSLELLLMIPSRQANAVYVGTTVASLLGLVLLALAAVVFGAVGGVCVWIIMKVVLLSYYAIVLHRRRSRGMPPPMIGESED